MDNGLTMEAELNAGTVAEQFATRTTGAEDLANEQSDLSSPSHSSKSMRAFTKLQDLTAHLAGETVWIRARNIGGLGTIQRYSFVLLDGLFSAQAVMCLGGNVSEETVRFVAGLAKDSTIDVWATVKATELEILGCTQRNVELAVKEIVLVALDKPGAPRRLVGTSLTDTTGCGPRRVTFTTISTIVGSPNEPLLSFPSPPSFGGNDTYYTKPGCSFKKLEEKEFIRHCVKKSKTAFDVKMKAMRSDGSEEDYGFVSTRTSQTKFVPLDMRGISDQQKLGEVCDGELLAAVSQLLDLKKELGSGKNRFWKHKRVKGLLYRIESIFRALGEGWLNGTKSRKRNMVIELIKGPLSTTRQTFNKYLERSVMQR